MIYSLTARDNLEIQVLKGRAGMRSAVRTQAKRVFLVYGRNREARAQLTALLGGFGLEVLDWEAAIAITGNPTPHAQQVLQAAMENVSAVVVLMSGDEEARLRSDFCTEDEVHTEGSLQPQSRPNVIFEAGLAFALFPRRTVVVQLGRLRQISDLAGTQYVPLDASPEAQQALANRLRTAGCDIRNERDEIAASGLPSPDAGLPPVVPSSPSPNRIAVFRKLKSLFSVPGMGGSLEVASQARIGEDVVLSTHCSCDSDGLAIQHWLPGSLQPSIITAGFGQNDAGTPVRLTGPAGVHFFDLVNRSSDTGETQILARSSCAVAER